MDEKFHRTSTSSSGSLKRSNSVERISAMNIDDEDDLPVKPMPKPKPTSQIPKLKETKKISQSMVIPPKKVSTRKWNTPAKTPRPLPVIPSIGRQAVQGVLVRFFRNGEAHHPGVKVAINELEIKSWEAFLNYLNQQSKLVLASGGIKHVYSLSGHEIRSINKFQNRQSYVVASGMFTRTKYHHLYDSFNDEQETNSNNHPNGTSDTSRWRSPPNNGEQIFLLPYSRLNMYESIILNRNLIRTFEQWLNEEVTDILSHYIGNEMIRHLYAITKTAFTEVTSFSQLFNTLKVTDTFIGCTDDEFQHSKRYLITMKPDDFFANSFWPRKPINGLQRSMPKQEVKFAINWVHGYDGTNEQTKTLYTISENELLYVIDSVCILYQPDAKSQRFYTKHTSPITCVNIHRYHSIVASSEMTVSSKGRPAVSIHIWDYVKLETIIELRKEQYGSDVLLLSFSPKPDDHFLLIVSRDKPKTVLFINWKQNEVVYSITTKSDRILSALFVFDTVEWIACLSQQHLLFYHINWNEKPLRVAVQKESNVQNIYTGAMACDHSGERLVVGDKVGSAHVWRLIDEEPKLVGVKEGILENEVQIIVSTSPETFVLANGQYHVKVWHTGLDTIENVPVKLKDRFGAIQSICCFRRGLAIGTKLNHIIWQEMDTEEMEVIMRGHMYPATCICCNKNTDHFFSVSSDRYLFKWNNRTRAVEWSIKSPQMICCAAVHPERNIIVLGTETSKLLIYDTISSYYIASITLKMSTGVKSIRFSPDGGDLAIGLQNGAVCLFDVLGNGEFHLRTDETSQNNTAPVTDVIWSVDSSYLMAVYSDNNYNIWTIPSFDVVKGKNIQNIPWQQVVHPVTCNFIDKSLVETHSSAIVLSPNLVVCCGKDGHIRFIRNNYERNAQTFKLGLGSVQNMIPSTSNNTYLVSINNNPILVEVQINIGE